MHALVAYESLWVNIRQVAHAMGNEPESRMAVERVTSELASSNLVRHDPVAVGGPTHAFSMTRVSTWHAAMGNDDALEIGTTKGAPQKWCPLSEEF
ncbi:hypothetical protein GCM10007382_13700 [Salinibacterium xinjiangense]|uniref:Uncharacterized protein n=1 Tax=Salinibacterium xinjiangense TaxID=386302 RepID=A0A2C8Y5U3_9MICO|nr:hypothetical protein [Salinibacterium xinjiangense]GGK94706.1 hypothetical protein GCM10007382_13700 [Salinibacterium xinjiangense]SOE45488.1 hypothetical protein SAMN06296378_0014 [Salinibacterium xinjiangense]